MVCRDEYQVRGIHRWCGGSGISARQGRGCAPRSTSGCCTAFLAAFVGTRHTGGGRCGSSRDAGSGPVRILQQHEIIILSVLTGQAGHRGRSIGVCAANDHLVRTLLVCRRFHQQGAIKAAPIFPTRGGLSVQRRQGGQRRVHVQSHLRHLHSLEHSFGRVGPARSPLRTAHTTPAQHGAVTQTGPGLIPGPRGRGQLETDVRQQEAEAAACADEVLVVGAGRGGVVQRYPCLGVLRQVQGVQDSVPVRSVGVRGTGIFPGIGLAGADRHRPIVFRPAIRVQE
jgi:hypothetical protein